MMLLACAAMLTIAFGALGVFSLWGQESSLVPPDRLQQLTRAQLDLSSRGPSLRERTITVAASLRQVFASMSKRALQLRLSRAGLRDAQSADLYLAARFLGPLAALAIAVLLPCPLLLTGWLLPVAAFLAPDLLLRSRIRRRQKAIARGMSAMLDLLVICVEAGLGLDQAVLRVAEELVTTHPEIHEELLQINREQRAGKPRTEAWETAVERMDVPEMTAFTSMAMQAERFGTPNARALGEYAANVRLTLIQIAEEKAAKTTIKIIFPLALFIFPSIFIVLLGPAVLTIMRNF